VAHVRSIMVRKVFLDYSTVSSLSEPHETISSITGFSKLLLVSFSSFLELLMKLMVDYHELAKKLTVAWPQLTTNLNILIIKLNITLVISHDLLIKYKMV